MGVHCVHSLHQVAGRSVKQVFSCSRAPEGVAVEAMVRLRTQSNIPIVAVFLNQAGLHKESSLLAHHRSMTRMCNPPNRVLWEFEAPSPVANNIALREKKQRTRIAAFGHESAALH